MTHANSNNKEDYIGALICKSSATGRRASAAATLLTLAKATTVNINVNDVLCGRGFEIFTHPGNEQYCNFVQRKKQDYQNARSREKRLIAQSIVGDVRNLDPPGRFLRKDPHSGSWYDVGDEEARCKTTTDLGRKAKQTDNKARRKTSRALKKKQMDEDFKETREVAIAAGRNTDKAVTHRFPGSALTALFSPLKMMKLPLSPRNATYQATLRNNGVLICRCGSKFGTHPGNRQYCEIFKKGSMMYRAALSCRMQELKISQLIASNVANLAPPGRFLMRHPHSDDWYNIGYTRARSMISRALRNFQEEMVAREVAAPQASSPEPAPRASAPSQRPEPDPRASTPRQRPAPTPRASSSSHLPEPAPPRKEAVMKGAPTNRSSSSVGSRMMASAATCASLRHRQAAAPGPR